jgi:hypothetical protein
MAVFDPGLRMWEWPDRSVSAHGSEILSSMRMEAILTAVILASFTGVGGYYLGATADRPVWKLPRNAAVSSDYRVSSDSFSEVEQLTSMLDALAERYVEQAQRLIVEDYMLRTSNGTGERQEAQDGVGAAIRLLEEGIEEFRSSRQELILLPTLLYGLKREGLPDAWLATYLDALKRHPTSERVVSMSADAMRMARLVGREDEVALSMMRLTGAPFIPTHSQRTESGSTGVGVATRQASS